MRPARPYVLVAAFGVLFAAVAAAEPTFVGHQVCSSCHLAETKAWQGSQHARAMEPATPQTVLGRFDGATFAYNGITSRFFCRGARFFARTDGPDGKLADFEVKYTFGVFPLQQYLAELPGGRLQALSIAWDTRPHEAGGQRWFHLYPEEKIDHRDPLHWTRRSQNWNAMCSDCHSTNVRHGYDLARDRFATTWSEIDVACEACHGPGSSHVEWAERKPGSERLAEGKGLVVQLDARKGVSWAIDPASGNAARSRPLGSRREVEACAPCHSRRASLGPGTDPALAFLDAFAPALLREGLYFSDGQQEDEVYIWGSFLQSKMYAKGVTCSDCHEPHSGKLRAEGNSLCAQCHATAKYDSTVHTMHRAGAPGSQCVSCHLPTRTYMQIDPRHDHSIRIPRPDWSVRFGTPNPCSDCHADKDTSWAAASIERAHGAHRKGFQTFAAALHGGRTGEPGAGAKLAALARQRDAPAIARATALAELGRYPDPETPAAIEAGLDDPDPLVRATALDTLLSASPEARARLAEPLLEDPVRLVRIKAARALAGVAMEEGLTPQRRARRERAFAEYVAVMEGSAELPGSHLNLGAFYGERGDVARAEAEYRTATRIGADFAPGWVNLADLYRALGRDGDAEATLTRGLKEAPEDGDLLHSLGLLRARQKRLDEAILLLARAAKARPDNPRYAYVHAVALHDAGRRDDGIDAIDRALERFPNDRELLYARASFAREAGELFTADRYARRLADVAPADPRAAALLRALGIKSPESK
jgi:predicted CXXCH cytochrome family protein